VDALLVIRDEAGGDAYLLAHLGIVEMTLQTDSGLLGLAERRLRVRDGNNGVRPMAVHTGGSAL